MSDRIMFIDTAATGRFLFSEPVKAPEQPHCCRLCFVIEEEREQRIATSYLIKPTDAWKWDAEQIQRHSVTPEVCAEQGQPAHEVFEHFWPLLESCDSVIAYNAEFHWKIVERMCLEATGQVLGEEHAFVPVSPPILHLCAMRLCTDIVGKRSIRGRILWPALWEAYRHFTGIELAKVRHPRHNGLENCQALRAVWHGIEDHKGRRKYG